MMLPESPLHEKIVKRDSLVHHYWRRKLILARDIPDIVKFNPE